MSWTCVDLYGCKKYYNEYNQLHRLDGPAFYDSSNKHWYVNGLRHRSGGLPASEYLSGWKEWWENGVLHRLGGLPACESQYCTTWHIYGIQYSKKQVICIYETLAKFGRFCLKKIRLMRIKRVKTINNQLLCMPPNSKYLGGQDYLKALIWFL